MKNKKIILIALTAAIIGLGAGYLLFHKGHAIITVPEEHGHEQPSATNHQSAETEYTCSMHPQIRQNEPGICPICEMDLIPVEDNTSGNDDPTILEMTQEAVKLANIQTTTIGTTSDQPIKMLTLNGKIQKDERRAASQTAHIPGRIEQLFVSFTGERVQKGQKLATIYSPELITAQRELLEAKKFQDVSTELLEAARNKLRFWKISDATIQRIEGREQIKETFTLYAENSGIVTNRRIAVGDYVKQGQILFDIINLSRLWVLFDVYEEDLANIQVGNTITFTTPAIPNKSFTTKITYIDPLINPVTRAASIRGEVSNLGRQLKPEMFVKGTLKAPSKGSRKNQLTIPKTAVMWTGKRSVVYVKMPDIEIPSFQFREIELGDVVESNYLIANGLSRGEIVVTNGAFSIDAAAQLNNQRSMMNQEVRIKKEARVGSPNFQGETPLAFKEQLGALTEKYIALKDAFVNTNNTAAKIAAATLHKELKRVNSTLIEGEAHLYWMDKLNGLEKHSEKITQLEDIEKQRKQFEGISDLMIPVLKAFGVEGMTIYVQHCPMAFNNKGGDWLSTEERIRNPYFGDKMMKCGSVTGTIAISKKEVKVQ